LAAERLGGGVVHFEDERALKAKYLRDGRAMPAIPDAFLVLAIGDKVQAFCIEADRATVDLRSWRVRVEQYRRWAERREFRQGYRDPAVLVVVGANEAPARRRVAALADLIKEESRRTGLDPSRF